MAWGHGLGGERVGTWQVDMGRQTGEHGDMDVVGTWGGGGAGTCGEGIGTWHGDPEVLGKVWGHGGGT